MSQEQIIYKTTRSFSTSTMKQLRSNVRRMLRKNLNSEKQVIEVIEFSFADSELENAKTLHVKVEFNVDINEDNTNSTKEFLLQRVSKLSYKTSEMSRFQKLENVYELYAKCKAYYNLKQR